MTKPTVFISYSRKDSEFAHRLADDLGTAGYSVWKDIGGLRGGRKWVREIDKAVRGCDAFILIISPDSMASDWVTRETLLADALDKPIIPILWRKTELPVHLVDIQYVDFRSAHDDAMQELCEALPTVEGVPTPAPSRVAPAPKPTRQPFEPEMIPIPVGEFLMGSDPEKDKHATSDEQPQHALDLPEYYIAKTPITIDQYADFVKSSGHRSPWIVESSWNESIWFGGKPPSGREYYPVVAISWYDALAYCRWLSKFTGKSYHLPSEVEWEKAARGTDGRIWPWGNQWDPERCNSAESDVNDATPVGVYPEGASPYGVLDMAGNVWEWTRTLWGKKWDKPDFKYPYNPADGREDLEASDDVLRVLRGGSYKENMRAARCATRSPFMCRGPDVRDYYIGFRVVISPGSPQIGSGC